jgi:hypothetical protein
MLFFGAAVRVGNCCIYDLMMAGIAETIVVLPYH